MADSAEHDEGNPSLSDMWKALMRIENNTNSLINDLKVLQNNYKELRESLDFSQAKIDELTKSNSDLHKKVKNLEKKNSGLNEKVDTNKEEMSTKLQEKITQIESLEKKLDDLEQYTRKVNLEIFDIPEVEGEDLEGTIIKLAESIDIDLYPEDIDIVHRFKRGETQPKPIIVRFSNYHSKDEMYRNRRKLRRANVQHLSGAEKIYINENLTAQRAGFFKKVRDKKRQHKEWRVWTTDGKIFIKPNPATKDTIKIDTEEDLKKL